MLKTGKNIGKLTSKSFWFLKFDNAKDFNDNIKILILK